MTNLKDLVATLYAELEGIDQEHDELTDTDVRESLHVALTYYFVWGKPLDRLPINYAMFSAAGDAAVTKTVNQFLREAVPVADASAIPVGQARLDILQDASIKTPGDNEFDFYIGSVDTPLPPEAPWEGRFQPGEYEGD
jgi:hypothetical protein